MSGAILILSGPSGAGKSTLIHKAEPLIGDYYFSISTTTRKPREGETEGVDYHFVTKEYFEQEIKEGEFLEYAKVHDNYYGTSLRPVKRALAEDKLVLFDIDVQGHRLAKERFGDIITSVFITPPSYSELKRRLLDRSLDNDEVIQKRLDNALKEIEAISEYDFVIINDDLDRATKEFVHIANSARLKLSKEELSEFVNRWRSS